MSGRAGGEGEAFVVPISRVRVVGTIAVAALLGALGIAAFRYGQRLPLGNLWVRSALAGGGLLAGMTTLLVPFGVLRLLRRRRLIVGPDRLRLVERADRVVGEVPFDNIADVRVVEIGAGVTSLGIVLARRDRGDTFWPLGLSRHQRAAHVGGHDFGLDAGYVLAPEAIRDEVVARLQRWRSSEPIDAG